MTFKEFVSENHSAILELTKMGQFTPSQLELLQLAGLELPEAKK